MSGMRPMVLMLVALLAACAGPRDHFYTLSATQPPTAAATAPQADTPQADAPRNIVTLLVRVPSALDRPELMVHRSYNEVQVLEHERWLGLPSDQIAQTLALDLEARRPDLWVGRTAPGGAAATRIVVDIVQMTVTSERRALIEAQWQVRAAGSTSDTIGTAVLEEPLEAGGGSGNAAIATAFSREVAMLAERLLHTLPR
jgi:uncharacterized lipoprotein YmbA